MAMSYDEVLNTWGRKLLTDRGYTISPKARIDVNIVVINNGGCDTCSYDEAVVEITVLSKNRSERASVSIDSYRFRDILLELIEVSADN